MMSKRLKERLCLKCQKMFKQRYEYDYFCSRCKAANERMGMPPDARSATRQGREVFHATRQSRR